MFADSDQGTRVLYIAWHERRLPRNFILHFPVENVSTGKKTEKKRLIYPTTLNRFSSSFHQNDRTMAGHLILVIDDPENVGQGQYLQK